MPGISGDYDSFSGCQAAVLNIHHYLQRSLQDIDKLGAGRSFAADSFLLVHGIQHPFLPGPGRVRNIGQ
ncbi:hypothetical protein D3C71_2130860 [compost metagenome]